MRQAAVFSVLSFSVFTLAACTSIATESGLTSHASQMSKANISEHAPNGHASAHYVCNDENLLVDYVSEVPAITFKDDVLPITRLDNSAAEQYSSSFKGQDVLLTILDHAATLKVGDTVYKSCEKIACVALHLDG